LDISFWWKLKVQEDRLSDLDYRCSYWQDREEFSNGDPTMNYHYVAFEPVI
jgi:hypothetical protein